MKKLLPILLMAVVAAGAADGPATHTVRISTSDGDWALVFPLKPVETPPSELKMRTGHVCVENKFQLNIKKAWLLTALLMDCPGYKIPAHERQAFFDRMLPDAENISANRPGEITTRKINIGNFAGQELRKKYATMELGLQTYVGKHSVLMLTALWMPANATAVEDAELFLSPR